MNTQLGNDVAMFRYIGGRGIVPDALVEPTNTPKPETLRINIVFSDLHTTKLALKRAVELAIDLSAETQIIVPHVVPYPLDLECPVVPLEFTCHQLQIFAGSTGADPYIHVYLCRDVMDLLRKLLPAGSIAVLGTSKRWLFPTRSERIARRLRKGGCDVVLV